LFFLAVRQRSRAMHLGDRRRRDRFAEGAEQFLDRLADAFLDDGARFFHREGRQLVLQRGEVPRQFDADNVGPRRKKLSKLDIGRPERRQRGCEPFARAAGRVLRRRFPRKTNFRKR